MVDSNENEIVYDWQERKTTDPRYEKPPYGKVKSLKINGEDFTNVQANFVRTGPRGSVRIIVTDINGKALIFGDELLTKTIQGHVEIEFYE